MAKKLNLRTAMSISISFLTQTHPTKSVNHNLIPGADRVNFIILLAYLVSCSPANTKISANPRKIAVTRGSSFLICPVAGLAENESAELMHRISDQINENVKHVVILNYWEMDFKARQLGVNLPDGQEFDTSAYQLLQTKLNIRFILLSRIDKLQENYQDELNNPNYQTREAIIRMKFVDLETRKVIWHCNTRVFANPLKANGSTQQYSINLLSVNYAVNKAFKKSIQKLQKAIVNTP